MRIANELGAGNAKGAKFATMVSLVNTVLVGFIFWLIIMAFNEKLALIFTSSSSVVQMVNELAILLASTILLNCLQPVLSGDNLIHFISTKLKSRIFMNQRKLQFLMLCLLAGIYWFSGVAVGCGKQAIVAYINIGSYYLVGMPLGVFLGWLLPSGIIVSVSILLILPQFYFVICQL